LRTGGIPVPFTGANYLTNSDVREPERRSPSGRVTGGAFWLQRFRTYYYRAASGPPESRYHENNSVELLSPKLLEVVGRIVMHYP
jgi:hypothetical protein